MSARYSCDKCGKNLPPYHNPGNGTAKFPDLCKSCCLKLRKAKTKK